MGNLVITRDEGERFFMTIDDVKIEVYVKTARLGQAVIAVKAPKQVAIVRENARCQDDRR